MLPTFPLGCKFVNSQYRKDVLKLYEQLRQWERPELVEDVRQLEQIYSEDDYKQLKKELSKKTKNKKV
ncbi:hypothetical protein SD81_039470 [Tolypothrix campylonemoides VB511288]|nr:hypothetical protein SD81_039470 [Tolypothrix campylonemoides VB511288]